MKKVWGRNIKKAVAGLMAALTLVTSIDMTGLSRVEAAKPVIEDVSGNDIPNPVGDTPGGEDPSPITEMVKIPYYFDLPITLKNAPSWIINYNETKNDKGEITQEGIKVNISYRFLGQPEVGNDTFNLEITSKTTAVIRDIPIYIKAGTGDQTEGGLGTFETPDSFYHVQPETIVITQPQTQEEIESGIAAEQYKLDTSTLIPKLTMDDQERFWTATLSKNLEFTEREKKNYSYRVYMYSDQEVKLADLKELTNNNPESKFRAEYFEGGSKYVEAKSVEYLGNSTYEVRTQIPKDLGDNFDYCIPMLDGKTCYYYDTQEGKYIKLSAHSYAIVDYKRVGKVVYINNTEINSILHWYDKTHSTVRPDPDTYIYSQDSEVRKYLHLYQVSSNGTTTWVNPSEYSLHLTQKDDHDDEWDIQISNLPVYDTNGRILSYYFKIGSPDGKVENPDDVNSKLPSHSTSYDYRIMYNNKSASVSSTRAYSGGVVYAALDDSLNSFSIDLEWDDDQWNNKRPEEVDNGNISIQLWRYAGSNADKGTAVTAPNGNQYSVTLNPAKIQADILNPNPTENKQTFTLADLYGLDATKLPLYNEEGLAYTYYVTVSGKELYYDIHYENEEKYRAENEETVHLVRAETSRLTATKLWKASGETDYIGTRSVLQLQRRLKVAEDQTANSWENVQHTVSDGVDEFGNAKYKIVDWTEATAAASVSVTGLRRTFIGVPLYSPEGKTYEYRVVEAGLIKGAGSEITKVVAGWNDGDNNTSNNEAECHYTFGGHSYVAKATYNDETGEYIVENRLQEDMDYKLQITWEGLHNLGNKETFIEALESYYSTYNIYQNGVPYGIIEIVGQVTPEVKDAEGNVTEPKKVEYSYQFTLNGETEPTKTGVLEQTGTGDLADPYKLMIPDNQCFQVPKYDPEGQKYKYTVSEILVKCADKSTDLKDKATKPWSRYQAYVNGTHEGDNPYFGQANIRHIFYSSGGTTYYFNAQKKWNDNITDSEKRSVDMRLVVLRKHENNGKDEYLFVEELKDDSSKPIGTTLNNANNFYQELVTFTNSRIQKDDTNRETFKTWLTSLTEVQKDALHLSEEEKMNGLADNDIYYAVVEYSISYDGQTQLTPLGKICSENQIGEVIYVDADNNGIISGEEYKATSDLLHVEDGGKVSIGVHDYDIEAEQVYIISNKVNNAKTAIFTNSIRPVLTKMLVETKWHDSNNASGYRNQKYEVELYRTTKGLEPEYVDKKTVSTPENPATGDATTYSFDFGEQLQFNNDGNMYTYIIKQYIVTVDESGNETRSLIDENATVKTTKNHYTTEVEEVVVEKIVDGQYVNETKITATNIASNLKYSTEFYVLWHDEESYQKNSRPDMNYRLYFKNERNTDWETASLTDADLYQGEYQVAITTAADPSIDGGSENPYYQKITFSGLQEYDSDGDKLHYYLKEERTGAAEVYHYKICYYDRTQSSEYSTGYNTSGLIVGPQVTGASYYHRNVDTENGVTISTPNDSNGFCGEGSGVINFITDTVQIAGSKKWVNLNDSAKKPDCFIYLFRHSNYDDHNLKPEYTSSSQILTDFGSFTKYYENQNKHIDITHLSADNKGYTFRKLGEGQTLNGLTKEAYDALPVRDFEKFDSYGAVYTYDVAEIIKGEMGLEVDAKIMDSNAENAQTLINTFDPYGANSRSIFISKDWDDTPANIGENAPWAKFTVYQYACPYVIHEGENARLPKAEEVSYKLVIDEIQNNTYGIFSNWGDYLNTHANKVETFYLQYDKTQEKGLAKKEITGLPIYSPTSQPYLYFVTEDTSYVPSYSVSTDAGEAMNACSGKGAGDAVEDKKPVLVNKSQYDTSIVNNIAIISNYGVSLDIVTNTGTEQSPVYVNTSAKNGVVFTNTYQSHYVTELRGSVLWREGATEIAKETRPISSKDEADALIQQYASEHIVLNIKRAASTQADLEEANTSKLKTVLTTKDDITAWDSTDSTWKTTGSCYPAVASGVDYSVVWSQDADNPDIWHYVIKSTTTGKGFLQYSDNGNPYVYYVTESFKDNKAVKVNYTVTGNDKFVVASAANVKLISEGSQDTYLTIPQLVNTQIGGISILKNWVDGYDSYKLRPKAVLVMLQYKKQDEDEQSWRLLRKGEDNTPYIRMLSSANKWTWTLSQLPVQYVDDYTNKSSGTRAVEMDRTNYLYRAVELAIGYSDQETVSTVTDVTWVPVSKAFTTFCNFDGTVKSIEDVDCIWDFKSSGSVDNTVGNEGELLYHNNVGGDSKFAYISNKKYGSYEVSQPKEVDINNPSENYTRKIYVSNGLSQKTSLKVIKNWDDQSNIFGVRPTSLRITIQQRTKDGETLEAWKDVNTVVFKNTKSIDEGYDPNQWVCDYENLPQYDEMGKVLQYRAVEMGYVLTDEDATDDEGETILDPNGNPVKMLQEVEINPEAAGSDGFKKCYSVTANLTPGENKEDLGYFTLNADDTTKDIMSNPKVFPHNGSYALTNYTALFDNTDGNQKFETTFTNAIQGNGSLTLQKNWVMEGGNTSAATNNYKATFLITAHYQDGTTASVEQVLDGKESTKYRKVIEILPRLNKNLSPLDVEHPFDVVETKVNLGGTDILVTYKDENDKDYTNKNGEKLGTFTDEDGTPWIVKSEITTESGDNTITVTNTPLTKHILSVSYTNDADETASKGNMYGTRPTEVTMKLQYRKTAGGTWTDLDNTEASLDIYKNLLSTVPSMTSGSNQLVAVHKKVEELKATETDPSPLTSVDGAYSYTFDGLPAYYQDDDDIGAYEYRILEINQTYKVAAATPSLEVSYVDSAAKTDTLTLTTVGARNTSASSGETGSYKEDKTVGGYAFAYEDEDYRPATSVHEGDENKDITTYLEKTLYKVAICGTKIWDDLQNVYHTRPQMGDYDANPLSEAGNNYYKQSTDSKVKISIYKGSALADAKSENLVSLGATNKWTDIYWRHAVDSDITETDFAAAKLSDYGYSSDATKAMVAKDRWVYLTDASLPKYAVGSNDLQAYIVKEDEVKGYNTSYEVGASEIDTIASRRKTVTALATVLPVKFGNATDTRIYYPMSDICNQMKSMELTVKKVWDITDLKYLNFKPVSVTLMVQRKAEGESAYKVVTQDDGTGQMNPVTVTFNYADASADGNKMIAQKVISKLPLYDANGKKYTYRAVETEIKDTLKNLVADGSGTETNVTWSIKLWDNTAEKDTTAPYPIYVKVGAGAEAKGAITNIAEAALVAGQNYEFGLYNVSSSRSDASGEEKTTYTITNKPVTATASAKLNWEEKRGSDNNDSVLVDHFRPTHLDYVLQQHIKEDGVKGFAIANATPSDWATYTGSVGGVGGATTAFEWTVPTGITATNTIANGVGYQKVAMDVHSNIAISTASKLPVYGLVNGAMVEYEYRIVESDFEYPSSGLRSDADAATPSLTKNTLDYADASLANMDMVASTGVSGITSRFNTTAPKDIKCKDHYYTGSQINEERTSHNFVTTIKNTLAVDELTGVKTQLSGQIEWRDNSNILGKRPDTDGITMVLRASYLDNQATSVEHKVETEFVVGKAEDNGSTVLTTSMRDKDSSAIELALSWTKNEYADEKTAIWTYTINDLPLYTVDGHYITYSVYHKSDNNGDYRGQAEASNSDVLEEHHVTTTGMRNSETRTVSGKTSSYPVYAKGTVTDLLNNYDTPSNGGAGPVGKQIVAVDFLENLVTEASVVKTWIDAKNRYGVRPDTLTVKLQQRSVSLDTNGDIEANSESEWVDYTQALAESENTYAKTTYFNKEAETLLRGKASADAAVNVDIDTTGDNHTWTYTYKELPMVAFDATTIANGKMYQYRVLEQAIVKESGTNTSVYSDKLPDYYYAKAGATDDEEKAHILANQVPHIGTYYMCDYDTSMQNKSKAEKAGYSNTDMSNLMDVREDITVHKEWIVDDEEVIPAQVTIILTDEAEADKKADVYTEVLTAESKDATGNKWAHTWSDIPKYDDNFKEIHYYVLETKVDSLDVDNSKALLDDSTETIGLSAEDANGRQWIARYEASSDGLRFTVKNTPTTSAKLNVEYKEDLNNSYGTRFEATTGLLQYKVSDGTWTDVRNIAAGGSADNLYYSLISVLESQMDAGQGSTAAVQKTYDNSSSGDNFASNYSYEFKQLPKFIKVGASDIKRVSYRIIEAAQKNATDVALSCNYDNANTQDALKDVQLSELTTAFTGCTADRACGGYTYEYYNKGDSIEAVSLSDDTLIKTLLLAALEGEKDWEDESNRYNSRDDINNQGSGNDSDGYVQTESSPVRITIENSAVTPLLQPEIKWYKHTTDSDRWTYASGNMPKYNAGTNDLARYTVKESCTNIHYSVSYGNTAEGLEREGAVVKQYVSDTKGNSSQSMTDITNNYKYVSIAIEKKDATSKEPMEGVGFTIYKAVINSEGKYVKADPEEIAASEEITDAEGKCLLNLSDVGDYLVVETSGKIGYEKTYEKGITLTMADFPSTIPLEVENDRLTGTLTLYKKDQTTGEALKDVTFAVYYREAVGSVWEKIWNFLTGKKYELYSTTGEDLTTGATVIEDLIWGDYYIQEVATRDGYVLTSKKYYFNVDASNVEAPIRLYHDEACSLEPVDNNDIFNEKNAMTFEKQSVTGIHMYGGQYQILAVDRNGNETPASFYLTNVEGAQAVSTFTLAEPADAYGLGRPDGAGAGGDGGHPGAGPEVSPTASIIQNLYGLKEGNYLVRETQAPEGFAIAEDLHFYVGFDGKLYEKKNGAAIAENKLLMKDMPLCNLEVIRSFVDDDLWERSIRPRSVTLQLYSYYKLAADDSLLSGYDSEIGISVENVIAEELTAVGDPVVIDVTVDQDSYEYVFENLPRYALVDGSYQPLSYVVQETIEEVEIGYDSGKEAGENPGDPETHKWLPTDSLYFLNYDQVTLKEPGRYNQDFAGRVYQLNIEASTTRSLQGGTILLSKNNLNGPALAPFTFKLWFRRIGQNSKGVEYPWMLYQDGYDVYRYDVETDTTELTAENLISAGNEATDGIIGLKGKQTARLILPNDVIYRVEEILEAEEPQYTPEYIYDEATTTFVDTTEGRMPQAKDGVTSKILVKNSRNIYTRIENQTENQTADTILDNKKPKTNAGGTIGVIMKDSDANNSVGSDFSSIKYQEGKYGVYWAADKNWVYSNSFTIEYREFDDEIHSSKELHTIEVKDYLNEDGSVKPKTDPCYDALRARYADFDISINENGVKVLYLSDDEEGMPYLNHVKVEFNPTIAAVNVSPKPEGGKVKVDNGTYQSNSDGKGENGEKRYPSQTTVFAQADSIPAVTEGENQTEGKDYYVDIEKLQLAIVDSLVQEKEAQDADSEEEPLVSVGTEAPGVANYLKIQSDNSFSVTLQEFVADVESDYLITGKLVITSKTEAGYVTGIELKLDNLPIPVDVGICFAEIPKAPEKPDEPEEPDEPDKPDKPDVPDVPDKPDVPEEPDSPISDEEEEIPSDPAEPEEPGESLENTKTGDRRHLKFFVITALASFMSLIILLFMNRKKRK